MPIKPPTATTKFFDPSHVLSQLDVREEMVVADLGCGSGFFTFAASEIVGEKGIVYAVDVQKAVLSGIESKMRLYGSRNVKTVWADLEIPGSTKIGENSVDLVIVATLLYQTKKHDVIFKEAKRIMKEKAKLLVLDWEKTEVPVGPDVSLRVSKKDVRKKAETESFKFVNDIEVDEHHYGMVFEE
jgi:ubiquinone/menaquinone biosynthesis C-methylase UbiE